MVVNWQVHPSGGVAYRQERPLPKVPALHGEGVDLAGVVKGVGRGRHQAAHRVVPGPAHRRRHLCIVGTPT